MWNRTEPNFCGCIAQQLYPGIDVGTRHVHVIVAFVDYKSLLGVSKERLTRKQTAAPPVPDSAAAVSS